MEGDDNDRNIFDVLIDERDDSLGFQFIKIILCHSAISIKICTFAIFYFAILGIFEVQSANFNSATFLPQIFSSHKVFPIRPGFVQL